MPFIFVTQGVDAMPISRKDFELGLDETTSKFFKTFADNPNKAFSLEELAKQWNIETYIALMVLLVFQNRGLIKAKFVISEYYYILA